MDSGTGESSARFDAWLGERAEHSATEVAQVQAMIDAGETENRCPSCGRLCQVWSDGSALTVNFACDWPDCNAGKGPWDMARPKPDPAVSGPYALENWRADQG